MNEIMTHECFSENFLLIPRVPQQLAASENQKSVQNSRHIGRVAHDSDKIARNRLDTSIIKSQRRGTERDMLFLLVVETFEARAKIACIFCSRISRLSRCIQCIHQFKNWLKLNI